MTHVVAVAALAVLAAGLSACVTEVRSEERAELTALLQRQIQHCHDVPHELVKDKTATLYIRLKRDGSLEAPPDVLSRPAKSRLAQLAIRAVNRCAPFKIPPEFADSYAIWKDLHVEFTM